MIRRIINSVLSFCGDKATFCLNVCFWCQPRSSELRVICVWLLPVIWLRPVGVCCTRIWYLGATWNELSITIFCLGIGILYDCLVKWPWLEGCELIRSLRSSVSPYKLLIWDLWIWLQCPGSVVWRQNICFRRRPQREKFVMIPIQISTTLLRKWDNSTISTGPALVNVVHYSITCIVNTTDILEPSHAVIMSLAGNRDDADHKNYQKYDFQHILITGQ